MAALFMHLDAFSFTFCFCSRFVVSLRTCLTKFLGYFEDGINPFCPIIMRIDILAWGKLAHLSPSVSVQKVLSTKVAF